MKTDYSISRAVLGAFLAAVIVFLSDCFVELGVVVAVAYVGVVWIFFPLQQPRWIWGAAATCTGLTLLGLFLSPGHGELGTVLANRSLTVIVIWLTAILCVRNISTQVRFRNSEQLLSATFASITDAVFTTDLHGKLVTMNVAAETLTGWTVEEARGHPFDMVCSLIHTQTREKIGFSVSESASWFNTELDDCIIISKAGAHHSVMLNSAPIRLGGGQTLGCLVVLRDVTQLKISDRALAKTETRLKTALEAGLTGTWYWDLLSNRVQADAIVAKLFSVDPELAAEQGFPLEELLKSIHPDDLEQVQHGIEATIQGGEDYHEEYRVVLSDGSLRWISARGRIECNEEGETVALPGVILDITDLKKTEATLLQNAETFARLIDDSPFGIYVVDSQFRIVRVSEGAQPAFRNVRPLLGRDFSEAIKIIWPESVANEIIAIFRNTLATGEPYIAASLTEKRSDEDTVESYEWQLQRMTLPDGKYGVVCYYFDSTKLRETERALRKSRKKAQQANRTKSEFLANMSHEIRTPMAAILGHADILLAHLTEVDHREFVSTIKRNGNHLLEIINDILDLSRIESGKLEAEFAVCDLTTLLADLESLMWVRVEDKPVEFRVVPEGFLPKTFWTDEKRLKQILINLVGNALKFTEEGHVEVSVNLVEEGNESFLRFDIEDTGIGISEETLENLFQPFSQGDSSITRNFGGSGLGLAICNRLTEILGGELDVTSSLGEGSTFSLLIPTGDIEQVPLIEVNLDTLSSSEEAPRIDFQLPYRILLVDDREDVRFTAHHFLEVAGATVATAEDGALAIAAIQEAQRVGQPFEAVVMDMHMPNVDGFTAVSELRSAGFRMPIIALTADAMAGDREECLEAGCDGYLSKPISHEKLVSTIHRLTAITSLEELQMLREQRKKTLREKHSPDSAEPPPSSAILVVDDNVDAAKATAMLLRLEGYETKVAHTGESALQLVAENSLHAILLDIGLPDINGCEVAESLRASGYQGLLIALSGRGEEEDKKKTLQAGFDQHLVKPADPEQLLALLEKPSQDSDRV